VPVAADTVPYIVCSSAELTERAYSADCKALNFPAEIRLVIYKYPLILEQYNSIII